MRQHPIPQNILDVEFKLFTRFTVKEFAYIASGVTIGAIFIYMWTEGRIPGIIAFPSFAMFAGVGLILGLVPIQDQPADKILSNYIKAINRPTLRVWKGEEMKLKLKARQDAGKAGVVDIQKAAGSKINVADAQEAEDLEKIEKIMTETGISGGKKEDVQKSSVTMTKENIEGKIVEKPATQLSGTINLLLTNKQGIAIPNATVIIKDSVGKPRVASKSNPKGEVLTTQKLEKGEYIIGITHDQYTFKTMKFIVEKDVYPIVKINAI